jgi:hypothetical protein
MPTTIRRTADSKITEVSEEQEDEEKIGRLYDGCALYVPQQWKFKKYILTMVFPDRFEETDKLNPMATLIYQYLKNPRGITYEYICGTVYISNDTMDIIIETTRRTSNTYFDKVLKEPLH